MTDKLVLKVKKFQLSCAKRFGTVEEKPFRGVYSFKAKNQLSKQWN